MVSILTQKINDILLCTASHQFYPLSIMLYANNVNSICHCFNIGTS